MIFDYANTVASPLVSFIPIKEIVYLIKLIPPPITIHMIFHVANICSDCSKASSQISPGWNYTNIFLQSHHSLISTSFLTIQNLQLRP